MEQPQKNDLRIGTWQVQPRLNRVTGNKRTTRITPKAMQVLLCLTEQPGHVVTRDQLMEAVWADTVVVENTLTRCISELRSAFDDDTREPAVIETIPKIGYRLIAPVLHEKADSAKASEHGAGRARSSSGPAHRPKRHLTGIVIGSAALMLLFISGFVWLYIARPVITASTPHVTVTPITSYPGQERSPALSPDGNYVAFVWNGGAEDNADIYVKAVHAETPTRLTRDPARDSHPVWSPDGSTLAFVRSSPTACGIFLVPASGGPVRKLIDCGRKDCPPTLAWSPDGKWLAVADESEVQEERGIHLLSIETLEKRKLTWPSEDHGDHAPAFSPDGQTLAFIRCGWGTHHVYTVSVSSGDEQLLTSRQLSIGGLAWSADGNHLVFSSEESLWRIARTGGSPAWFATVGMNIGGPSIAHQGHRLAYEQASNEVNIWQVGTTKPNATPTRLIASTRAEASPAISPDGQRVVFISNRSGTPEVWVSRRDGSSPARLTSFGGLPIKTPRWSPDSRSVAFVAVVEGCNDLFVVDAAEGLLRRLTEDTATDVFPSWSADGRWIYFGSDRSGEQQVWKIPAGGGEAVSVTMAGGYAAQESADGQYVYYTKKGEAGLWYRPTESGAEVVVLEALQPEDAGHWKMLGEDIYYVNRTSVSGPMVERFSMVTREVTHMALLPEAWDSGLAVDPNGRWILYAHVERSNSDIMLLEHFR